VVCFGQLAVFYRGYKEGLAMQYQYHFCGTDIQTHMIKMSSSSISYQAKDNTITDVSVVKDTYDGGEPLRDISGDVIEDGLRRGLKGRQFVIIALGSIIGPGCFYGLGYGIYEAGPLGLLIGFSVVGM
jgi:amino acid transporter